MGEPVTPTPHSEASEAVLIGGNHLASALLNLGMDPPKWRASAYSEVMSAFGQPVADIWVCWKAIMDWRDLQTTHQQPVVDALRKLANEAAGFLAMADTETHGWTNIHVLEKRIAEARAVLAAIDGASVEQR